MRQELETLEPELVERALRRGASWSSIARALGVSKQAAHRKHRHRLDAAGASKATDGKLPIAGDVRRCLQFAREEAQRVGQPAICCEHILLGILRCEDSPGKRALEALGVSHRRATECLQPTLLGVPAVEQPDGEAGAPQPGPARGDGLSAQARRVLEASRREAQARGDEAIRVEHVLLALLNDSRNGAVQTLEAVRATPAKVRRRLDQEWVAGGNGRPPGETRRAPPDATEPAPPAV